MGCFGFGVYLGFQGFLVDLRDFRVFPSGFRGLRVLCCGVEIWVFGFGACFGFWGNVDVLGFWVCVLWV